MKNLNNVFACLPSLPSPNYLDFYFAEADEEIAKQIVAMLEGQRTLKIALDVLKSVRAEILKDCYFCTASNKEDDPRIDKLQEKTYNIDRKITLLILKSKLSYYKAIGTLALAEHIIKRSQLVIPHYIEVEG